MFHIQLHRIHVLNLYHQKHRILHKQPLKRITSINHWYNEPMAVYVISVHFMINWVLVWCVQLDMEHICVTTFKKRKLVESKKVHYYKLKKIALSKKNDTSPAWQFWKLPYIKDVISVLGLVPSGEQRLTTVWFSYNYEKQCKIIIFIIISSCCK